MKITYFLFALCCLIGCNSAKVPDPDTQFKNYMAVRLDGNELKFKKASGDLTGDGEPDLVYEYQIERRNEYASLLGNCSDCHLQSEGIVIYENTGNGYEILLEKPKELFLRGPEDGKPYATVEMASIQKGEINFKTVTWAQMDPNCCPSVKGTIRAAIKDKKLVQVQ